MWKRYIKLLIFFIIFILQIHVIVAKADSDVEKEKVIVGYGYGYGIVDEIDSINHKGYGYELLTKMEQYSDLEFEFVEYTFEDAMKALDAGEIHVFGPMTYTQEREEKYAYIEEKFITEYAVLVGKGNGLYYDDPKSLYGKSVSIHEGLEFNTYLETYDQMNNVDFRYLPTTDPVEYYFREDADLYLVSSLNTFLDLQTVLNLGSSDLYLITLQENEELAKRIDQAWKKLLLQENSVMHELYLKYYGNTMTNRRPLSKEEVEILQSRPLRVSYLSNYEPIQYQKEDGSAAGISIDLLEFLGEKYGFEIEFLPYAPGQDSIEGETFDLLLYATKETKEREFSYEVLNPYTSLPVMLICEDEQLMHLDKVGMLEYFSVDYEAVEKQYYQSELTYYYDVFAMLQDYLEGDLDGILLTEVEAYYLLLEIGENKNSLHGTSLQIPFYMYLSKELPEAYKTAFDSMIDGLDDGETEELLAQTTSDYLESYNESNFLRDYYLEIVIFIFFIGILFFVFLTYIQFRKKQEIMHIVNHDETTALISLPCFIDTAMKQLENAEPGKYQIITMDIDFFRIINNIFGYEMGTEVIRSVANCLAENFRDSKAIVSRVACDQFVILREYQQEDQLVDLCENKISNVVKGIIGRGYKLSMSIGMYTVEDVNEPIDVLIDRANIARSKGKSYHKYTYMTFDDVMKHEYEMKTNIVYRMESALKNKEFYLVFQPKIDFETLGLKGAEALVRWKSKKEGTIYPNDFIPIFEANGFILQLDLYVFEQVCLLLLEHGHKMNTPIISVNLSGISLKEDGIVERLTEIVKRYQIAPEMLEIEVTETALTEEITLFAERVREFKAAGFQVSMDDFGAGASSLNRLCTLDVDVVKLDKVFLDYNINDDKGSVIVKHLIHLVKALNIKVVSEGVETAEQADWLREVGCNIAQGYYFERPLAKEQFLEIIENKKQYIIEVPHTEADA